MNERIEKLFGQALDQAVPETWTTLTPAQLSKLKDKFAELIVRECADAIVNDSRLNDVRSAANGCVRTIEEHFGVES